MKKTILFFGITIFFIAVGNKIALVKGEDPYENFFKIMVILDRMVEKLRVEVVISKRGHGCWSHITDNTVRNLLPNRDRPYFDPDSKKWDLAFLAKVCKIVCVMRADEAQRLRKLNHNERNQWFTHFKVLKYYCEELQKVRNEIAHRPRIEISDAEYRGFIKRLKPIADKLDWLPEFEDIDQRWRIQIRM